MRASQDSKPPVGARRALSSLCGESSPVFSCCAYYRRRAVATAWARERPSGRHSALRNNFSVRVAFVSERQVQKRFLQEAASTKYQIAVLVVRSCSWLAWRLPPPRKAWQG